MRARKITTGGAGAPTRMGTLLVEVEPASIAAFKAAIESYDNLATLRTENPRLSHLRLWFDERVRADVLTLIESLAASMPIRILDEAGM